jgi:hypothetical protein
MEVKMKIWKDGVLMLNARGISFDKKLHAKFYSKYADLKPDLEINTHARSGSFGSLLDERMKEVKRLAKGREIWGFGIEEWFDIQIMFGTWEEVEAKIDANIEATKAQIKKDKFREVLTREQVVDCLHRFTGDSKSYGISCNASRRVNALTFEHLNFDGVGCDQMYSIYPMVEYSVYSVPAGDVNYGNAWINGVFVHQKGPARDYFDGEQIFSVKLHTMAEIERVI